MPREFSRTRRVGEQIQRELAQLIQQEIKDPRLGMVTVSAVDVSRDLAVAKVYVTVLDDACLDTTLGILNKATGFLRHSLGKRMKLRAVPELRFINDKTLAEGTRLTELIERAVARDRRGE